MTLNQWGNIDKLRRPVEDTFWEGNFEFNSVCVIDEYGAKAAEARKTNLVIKPTTIDQEEEGNYGTTLDEKKPAKHRQEKKETNSKNPPLGAKMLHDIALPSYKTGRSGYLPNNYFLLTFHNQGSE